MLIRLLDVLMAVASCEMDPARRQLLLGHAERVCADARHTVANPLDLQDILARDRVLRAVLNGGVLAAISAVDDAAGAGAGRA